MPVPNSPSFVASLLRSLDPAPIGSRQEEEEISLATRPARASVEPSASAETQPGPDFRATVRANLRAAAQHVMRGHKTSSFRECSRPSCRNASNLIPYPVVIEPGVTDTDLETIFQRVVTAALEEVAFNPVSVETTPEWWNEPAFIS
jgi:hypothetical protein